MYKLVYYNKNIYKKGHLNNPDKIIHKNGEFITFIAEWQNLNINIHDPNDEDYIAPYILITDALWQCLLQGEFKFKEIKVSELKYIKYLDILYINKQQTPNDLYFEKVISKPIDPPISQPTITDRLEKVELGLEINLMDVNEVIMPYCLDLDYQVSQINSRLDNLNPVGLEYKIKTNFGGNDMTYTVLKRQIIGQQLELAKALDMIEVFESDRKLNKEQVEELTVLAHSYLK